MPRRSRSPDAHRDGLVSRAPRGRGPRAGVAGLVEARARVDRAVRAVEPAIALDVAALRLRATEGRHGHRVEHPLLALRQGAAELSQLLYERLALGLARHLDVGHFPSSLCSCSEVGGRPLRWPSRQIILSRLN